MAIRKKSAKKARNLSREPLQDHVRNSRGTGRKPVASIMVPQELKDEFDCFKAAYAAREGSATNEQVLRRWMDNPQSPNSVQTNNNITLFNILKNNYNLINYNFIKNEN